MIASGGLRSHRREGIDAILVNDRIEGRKIEHLVVIHRRTNVSSCVEDPSKESRERVRG
jgi:hypothetical protein